MNRKAVKILALAVVGAAVAFGVITLVALEGKEVVVLRTVEADGSIRQTRTWIADYQGASYIEAANPQREFLRNLQQHRDVDVVRRNETLRYRAFVLPQPQGHELIRQLLRERYGWADWWIGLLTDTSTSLAVRLEPTS